MIAFIRTTLGTDHHRWSTPLSVEACEERLRAAGLTGYGLGILRDRRLRGRCSRGHVVAYRPRWFNNSFAPCLVGDLIAEPRGTLLTAEVRPPRPVVAFFGLWLSLTTVLGTIGAIVAIVEGSPIGLLAIGFPLFGAGLLAIGGRLADGDRAYLSDEVARSIDGTDVPDFWDRDDA